MDLLVAPVSCPMALAAEDACLLAVLALAAQEISYEALLHLAVHLLATLEALGLGLQALGLALEVGQAGHQGHLGST